MDILKFLKPLMPCLLAHGGLRSVKHVPVLCDNDVSQSQGRPEFTLKGASPAFTRKVPRRGTSEPQ